MRLQTIEALRRLSRGVHKYSIEDLLVLKADLAAATEDEIRATLAPSPASRSRASATAKPDWFKHMEKAQRRVLWSAREAGVALVEEARCAGIIPRDFKPKRPLSFRKAAELVAAQSSGEKAEQVFSALVAKLEDQSARL